MQHTYCTQLQKTQPAGPQVLLGCIPMFVSRFNLHSHEHAGTTPRSRSEAGGGLKLFKFPLSLTVDCYLSSFHCHKGDCSFNHGAYRCRMLLPMLIRLEQFLDVALPLSKDLLLPFSLIPEPHSFSTPLFSRTWLVLVEAKYGSLSDSRARHVYNDEACWGGLRSLLGICACSHSNPFLSQPN